MSCKLLLILVGGLAVAGCNTANKRIGQEDPFLGEAVRYNAAVHTINPDPVYPEDAAQPGDSGDKGADAVKRYRTDAVSARHAREARQATTTGDTSSGSGPR